MFGTTFNALGLDFNVLLNALESKGFAKTLAEPTLMAHRIFEAATPLLRREAGGTAFRLIGVAISHLAEASADTGTLDARAAARTRAEIAMDRLRARFGRSAVERGIALGGDSDD